MGPFEKTNKSLIRIRYLHISHHWTWFSKECYFLLQNIPWEIFRENSFHYLQEHHFILFLIYFSKFQEILLLLQGEITQRFQSLVRLQKFKVEQRLNNAMCNFELKLILNNRIHQKIDLIGDKRNKLLIIHLFTLFCSQESFLDTVLTNITER